MLVEHVFITTMEGPVALILARDFLLDGGYQVINRTDTLLEVRRGLLKVAKAKRIDELPQKVRIHFDRGRVELALTIEEQCKAGPLHSELLVATASALEALLAAGRTADEAKTLLRNVSIQIDEHVRRRCRGERILLFVALLIVLAMIVLVIMVVSSI